MILRVAQDDRSFRAFTFRGGLVRIVEHKIRVRLHPTRFIRFLDLVSTEGSITMTVP